MNRKTLAVLLLALLLVVVLFVVSLLLGGREPGSGLTFDPESPGMKRMANWLSRPVKAEHLSLSSGAAADCRLENNQIIIKAGATCIFSVAADSRWTRQLHLQRPASQGGGSVHVTLEQTLPDQEKPLKVDQSLDPGKEAGPMDIYARQDYVATLTIAAAWIPAFGPEDYVIEIVEK